MNEISMKSYNRKPKKERTERQFDCRQANYVNYLFSRVKGRAKYKGMEFNISKEDIVIPEKCPVLGIPLYFSKGHNRGNTPSVDRIDNAKGYVKGNVAVISMKANALKKNATIEELKSILAYMEQHRKLQNEK